MLVVLVVLVVLDMLVVLVLLGADGRAVERVVAGGADVLVSGAVDADEDEVIVAGGS